MNSRPITRNELTNFAMPDSIVEIFGIRFYATKGKYEKPYLYRNSFGFIQPVNLVEDMATMGIKILPCTSISPAFELAISSIMENATEGDIVTLFSANFSEYELKFVGNSGTWGSKKSGWYLVDRKCNIADKYLHNELFNAINLAIVYHWRHSS